MFRLTTLFFVITLASATAYAEDSTKTNPKNSDASDSNRVEKRPDDLKNSSKSAALTLGAVTTEIDGDLTIVTARLNRSPDWKNLDIEEHGTFLQVKLPNTQVPASGEFLDGSGPFLRKLASFQTGVDDGALRLFINQDAAKAKLASSAELLGDRIVITIDHKKLEQLISPPENKVTPAVVQPVSSGEQQTALTSSQPTTPTQTENRRSTALPSQNLHAQLTKGAAVCALLFIALLCAQFFKSRKARRGGAAKSNDYLEPATMRVLSSISIGQKQKLTLVQVGGQQLLLGVTAESINLLTSIDQRGTATQFSRALENANPDAEIKLKSPAELTPAAKRQPLTASTVKARSLGPTKGSSINVAIGEDGPVNVRSNSKKDDDITKILRDRLRNLPPG
jgi:flagellar biosynthetic protein FliO